MPRYRPREIVRWIESIEQRSLDRARLIEWRLTAEPDNGAALLADPLARERLFAAMLSGDFELLRRDSFAPSWVSWVEDQRPYAWLTTHEQVLVDLVPPNPDPAQPGGRRPFEEKYHCSVSQLVTLTERMPGNIRFNVRNERIGDYCDEAVIDQMGALLSLSERFPECFYRLRQIRNTALPILGVDFGNFERHAQTLCAGYAKLYPDLPRGQDAQLLAVTRTASYPVPAQLEGRIAYYLAARQLWPGPEGAADERLEDWLAAPLASGNPLAFDFGDLGRLTDLFGRLYTAHHLFTAQLTGALGGTYGWKPREFDYAAQIHGKVAPPKYDGGRQSSLSTWFFALQAGLVVRPGERDSLEPSLPPGRLPNDIEWRSFLDRVNGNRHRFRERLGHLSELAGIAGAPASNLDPGDAEQLDALVDRLDGVARGGIDINKMGAAGIGVGVALAKINAILDMSDVLGLTQLCYAMAKATLRLGVHCEAFERMTGGFCKKRSERTALNGAMQDFDLPYAPGLARPNRRD